MTSKKINNQLSIFFSVLLMLLVAAPSIILSFDDTSDVSMFYSLAEEEEIEKHKIVLEKDINDSEEVSSDESQSKISDYFYKVYSRPHLNLISPPPKFIL